MTDSIDGVEAAKPAPKYTQDIVDKLLSGEITPEEAVKMNAQQSRFESATPINVEDRDQAFVDPKPQDAPFNPNPDAPAKPANPYAPTGWRKRNRVEFDLELPSGQMCRVMRLERDDLLRLNLLEHLDTFTPMLLDGTMDDDARQIEMQEEMKRDPAALGKMLSAIDKVVMACTVKPQIASEDNLINYGTERDWANPNFVATVHIDDIDTFERMYIFAAAFGRSMDDLKSLREQAQSLDGMAANAGLPVST